MLLQVLGLEQSLIVPMAFTGGALLDDTDGLALDALAEGEPVALVLPLPPADPAPPLPPTAAAAAALEEAGAGDGASLACTVDRSTESMNSDAAPAEDGQARS